MPDIGFMSILLVVIISLVLHPTISKKPGKSSQRLNPGRKSSILPLRKTELYEGKLTGEENPDRR